MFTRLFQTRQDKYRERTRNMNSDEVAKAYVNLSAQAEVLKQLTQEFTHAFSGRLPRVYLPRYSDVDNNFEADEHEAFHLLKKAQIWLGVLEEAIADRNIATDDLTIPMPGKPRLVNKRIDFSPYTSSFPRR